MSKEQDYLPAYTVRIKPRGLPDHAHKEPIVILVDEHGNEAGRLRGITGATLTHTHDWPSLAITFCWFEHAAVNHMPNPPEDA